VLKITLSSIKPSSIDALIDVLKIATGMKFDYYQRNFLEKRIDFRMRHLDIECYQDYINYIQEKPEEINLFLDKFTINYTYFFRNYTVFENFEKFLWIYSKEVKRKLKIWSAPCATGDEPYSIAMILDQMKQNDKNFPNFEIVASDIDQSAIIFAKNGIYGEYSVHETPKSYLINYFSREDSKLGPKFILKNKIKEKVEFIQEDIINGHRKNQKYDIIFCRNFFIYINQFAREKLLRLINSRLFDGGLLVLGGSETLPRNIQELEMINTRDRFYIKNLFTQNESFKNKLKGLFEKQRITKKEKEENAIKEVVKPINKEKKLLSAIKQVKEKSEKDLVYINVREKQASEEKIEKVREKKDLDEIKHIEPTEVRITDIVINKDFNGRTAEASSQDFKNSLIKKRSQELKQWELLLEKREKEIEQRILELDKKYQKSEQERKEAREKLKKAKEKEQEVKERIKILERLTRKAEQREKIIKQREKQLERRLKQIGEYSRQIFQQELHLNNHSNLLEGSEEALNSYEEKRIDRIEKPNNKNEILIPKGYYSIINSFDKNTRATKFIIEGLGSEIGLILKDPIHNIFGMSHISFPNSSASKQGYHLIFPHTFADTSVKDLYNNLLYNGAKKDNIKALIVGGAKLFSEYDLTHQENLDAVKNELKSIGIEIETEDCGGLSERSLIYDTINDALYVKKTWEFEFRRIN